MCSLPSPLTFGLFSKSIPSQMYQNFRSHNKVDQLLLLSLITKTKYIIAKEIFSFFDIFVVPKMGKILVGSEALFVLIVVYTKEAPIQVRKVLFALANNKRKKP